MAGLFNCKCTWRGKVYTPCLYHFALMSRREKGQIKRKLGIK